MPINEDIVSKHAEDAAFLWPQRELAVRSNRYRLLELRRLDDRLEANLDGLVHAGTRGWEICREQLLACAEEGEVFASAVLAFQCGSAARLDPIFCAAFSDHACTRAVIAAIAWHAFDRVKPLLDAWLTSSASFERYLAVAGFAVHRRQPAVDFSDLLAHPSERLQRRAVKAVAELGRLDCVAALVELRRDPRLELQANLALARLGAADEDTLESLCSFVTRPDCTYLAAALVQVAAPARSVAHIQALLGAGAAPAAIASIEASGDPFWVPSLIRLMSDQRVGHLAGEALSFITGVDLESADLAREAGRAVDDDADACADVWLAQESRLVRPSELAVARWWKQHAHQFTAGLRYLGGQVLGRVEQPPFDSEHVATLRSLVRTARSRQRSMAAHWLALSAPGKSSVNTLAFSVTPHVLPGWEPAQQDAPLTTIHARQSEGV